MSTICKIEEGAALLSIESLQPIEERVELSSVVELHSIDGIAIDRDTVDRITQRLLAAAETTKDKGPLQIDTDYDQARSRLKATFAGSLSAVKNVLNYKYEADKRLFEERTEVSAVVRIDRIQRSFADSLAGYLLAGANNHPQHDLPLRIDTDYDIARERLKLVFDGSISALSILLGTVYARLTQRLKRETPWSKENS